MAKDRRFNNSPKRGRGQAGNVYRVSDFSPKSPIKNKRQNLKITTRSNNGDSKIDNDALEAMERRLLSKTLFPRLVDKLAMSGDSIEVMDYDVHGWQSILTGKYKFSQLECEILIDKIKRMYPMSCLGPQKKAELKKAVASSAEEILRVTNMRADSFIIYPDATGELPWRIGKIECLNSKKTGISCHRYESKGRKKSSKNGHTFVFHPMYRTPAQGKKGGEEVVAENPKLGYIAVTEMVELKSIYASDFFLNKKNKVNAIIFAQNKIPEFEARSRWNRFKSVFSSKGQKRQLLTKVIAHGALAKMKAGQGNANIWDVATAARK